MPDKKKKSETEVLFPDIEVDGITVKPWSFGMLFELSEHLAVVIDKCEQKDIDKIFRFDRDNLDIKIVDAIKLLHIAGPEIKAIVAKTISLHTVSTCIRSHLRPSISPCRLHIGLNGFHWEACVLTKIV